MAVLCMYVEQGGFLRGDTSWLLGWVRPSKLSSSLFPWEMRRLRHREGAMTYCSRPREVRGEAGPALGPPVLGAALLPVRYAGAEQLPVLNVRTAGQTSVL